MSIGFIKPLPKEERFIKVTKGQWKVIFDRGASEARALMSPEQVDALEQLKGRGVTATKASKLVRSYSPERIAEKITIHDWLLGRADKRCSANPPGFLVAAIQDDFPAPTGFLKTREQAKSELRVITTPIDTPAPSRSPENQDRIRAQESVVANALDQQFDTFWDGLSEPEREEFERQAFNHAEPFNQRFYVERKQEGGILFKTIRRTILLAELVRRSQPAE